MSQYDYMTLQRAIAHTYRTADIHVPYAVMRTPQMVAALEDLAPANDDDLIAGALLVIEEFANDNFTPAR